MNLKQQCYLGLLTGSTGSSGSSSGRTVYVVRCQDLPESPSLRDEAYLVGSPLSSSSSGRGIYIVGRCPSPILADTSHKYLARRIGNQGSGSSSSGRDVYGVACGNCDSSSSSSCKITISLNAISNCTGTSIPGALWTIAGTTFTNVPNGIYSFPYGVGTYTFTVTLPSPNNFSRTFTQYVFCDDNPNAHAVLAYFTDRLNFGVTGSYQTTSAGTLGTASETIGPVTLWATVSGATVTNTLITSSTSNVIYFITDLGTTFPPTGVVANATYLGRTCSESTSILWNTVTGTKCSASITFLTGNAVEVKGCTGSLLPGVTVTSPDGAFGVTDAYGIAIIHPYLVGYCAGPDMTDNVTFTVSKTRFATQTGVSATFDDVFHVRHNIVTLLPASGYHCTSCCVDPIKDIVYVTIGTDTFTCTYDVPSGSWLGCLPKTTTGRVSTLLHNCSNISFGGPTSAYVTFGALGGCGLYLGVPTCTNSGLLMDVRDDCTGGAGAAINFNVSQTINCPVSGVFTASYSAGNIAQTVGGPGASEFYFGSPLTATLSE